MPRTAEQTKTEMENTTVNPVQTQSRTTVHITLLFDGVKFEPKALYEALDAKYATVRSEKDSTDMGNYIFRVSE